MNAAGWACERVFTPLPDFEDALREHETAALQPGDLHAALNQFDVLGFSLQYEICYTNVLTMLDLGGIAASRRGPRARRHAGHRRRTRRAEPRAARAVHRPVRHRRRRAQPAGCLRLVEGDAGLGTVAGGEAGADRRQRRVGLCPSVLRADLRRGRHDRRDPPHPRRRSRGHQALRDPRPRRHPAADPADRPVRRDRARPDRDRDHARLPLAVPVLPEHRHQATAPLPHRRDDRPGRARELPAPPATTRSACCRSPPATTPISRSW